MHKVFFLLGGNIGDRLNILNSTLVLVEKYVGRIVARSSVYETVPWGFVHDKLFLNQAIHVETTASSREVLSQIMKIELMMGRSRKTLKWEERTMDIDILFYDNIVLHDDNLTIPHPYLHQRRFVMEPLAELTGNFIHPVFNKSVKELLKECNDDSGVWVFD